MGRVILGTDPVESVVEEARAHVRERHLGPELDELLALRIDDAGIFRGPDPRPDPAAWIEALNTALAPDF